MEKQKGLATLINRQQWLARDKGWEVAANGVSFDKGHGHQLQTCYPESILPASVCVCV